MHGSPDIQEPEEEPDKPPKKQLKICWTSPQKAEAAEIQVDYVLPSPTGPYLPTPGDGRIIISKVSLTPGDTPREVEPQVKKRKAASPRVCAGALEGGANVVKAAKTRPTFSERICADPFIHIDKPSVPAPETPKPSVPAPETPKPSAPAPETPKPSVSVSVKTGSFKLDEVQEQITDTLFPRQPLRNCKTKEDLLKWAMGNFKTFKEYRDAAQVMGIDLAPTDEEVDAFHMSQWSECVDCDQDRELQTLEYLCPPCWPWNSNMDRSFNLGF